MKQRDELKESADLKLRVHVTGMRHYRGWLYNTFVYNEDFDRVNTMFITESINLFIYFIIV